MLTSLTLTQQLMCLSLGLFIIEILFFLWVKKNIIHLQKPDPILDQLQQFFDQEEHFLLEISGILQFLQSNFHQILS